MNKYSIEENEPPTFDKEERVTIRITCAQLEQMKVIVRKDSFSHPSISDFIRGAITRRIRNLKYE